MKKRREMKVKNKKGQREREWSKEENDGRGGEEESVRKRRGGRTAR